MIPQIDAAHKQACEKRNAKIIRGNKMEYLTDPQRDRQIILTFFSSGLRASELAGLKIKDILVEGNIGKIKSKGRRRTLDTFYFLFKKKDKLMSWLGA